MLSFLRIVFKASYIGAQHSAVPNNVGFTTHSSHDMLEILKRVHLAGVPLNIPASLLVVSFIVRWNRDGIGCVPCFVHSVTCFAQVILWFLEHMMLIVEKQGGYRKTWVEYPTVLSI